MSKVVLFNLRKLFTSSGTYVIPVLSILMFAALALPQLLLRSSPSSQIYHQSLLTYTIVFVTALAFLSYVVIKIFKKSQKDGTTLIILSKNFPRYKLIAANMISSLCMIGYFAILLFVGVLIIVSFDGTSTTHQRFAFATSVLIANLIVMGIFNFLIILYSTFLSERLITVVTLLIAILIPVVSSVIKPLVSRNFVFGDSYSVFRVNQNLDKKEPDINLDMTEYDGSAQGASYENYLQGHYKYFAWFDPWYQISGLYTSLFQGQNNNDKVWHKRTENYQIGSNDVSVALTFTDNNDATINANYGLIARGVPPNTNDRAEAINQVYANFVRTNYATQVNNIDFERQLILSKYLFDDATIFQNTNDISGGTKTEIANLLSASEATVWGIYKGEVDYYALYAYEKLLTMGAFTQAHTTHLNNVVDPFNADNTIIYSNLTDAFINLGNYSAQLIPVQAGYPLKIFTTSNYIDVQWLVLLWLSVTVIAGVGTYYIFAKTNIV